MRACMKARPAAERLTSGDLHAAFQHAELSVLAVDSGGFKFALIDPDGCVGGVTRDGKWAAGVPVQQVPLPAESLFDVPLLPAEYEPAGMHPAFAFGLPVDAMTGLPIFGHQVIKVHGCKYCGVVASSQDEILHDPAIHDSSCPRSSRRPAQDMVGYHATNASAARKILANGFRCGSKGLAGGAIYFATSEQHASRKSNNGNDIVLK